jgi:hypothetical protein
VATQLVIGFVAGFVSVWIFSSGGIAVLAAARSAVPFPAWSMAPTQPFGVPQTVSGAFWGGLWGVLYALLEPWLTSQLGWWVGGLAFGMLPLLALWFVALPLKGLPVGGGFATVPQDVLLHAVFGLGTAIVFRLVTGALGGQGS